MWLTRSIVLWRWRRRPSNAEHKCRAATSLTRVRSSVIAIGSGGARDSGNSESWERHSHPRDRGDEWLESPRRIPRVGASAHDQAGKAGPVEKQPDVRALSRARRGFRGARNRGPGVEQPGDPGDRGEPRVVVRPMIDGDAVLARKAEAGAPRAARGPAGHERWKEGGGLLEPRLCTTLGKRTESTFPLNWCDWDLPE